MRHFIRFVLANGRCEIGVVAKISIARLVFKKTTTMKNNTAEKRNSFAFMRKWHDMISTLSDATRLEVYDAIMDLAFYGNERELSQSANLTVSFIKPDIKGINEPQALTKEELAKFEKAWVAYRRKGNKSKAKEYWAKLSASERELVYPHILAYVGVREISYQKDFERYLRDKVFETVVYSNNKVIYDPNSATGETYMPHGRGIYYDEIRSAYICVDAFYGDVYDGYNDISRPDGASLILNNARGTIVWSSKELKWNNV